MRVSNSFRVAHLNGKRFFFTRIPLEFYRPSPHETRKAKLPSTLPVGVEPVLEIIGLLSLTPEKIHDSLVLRLTPTTHISSTPFPTLL